MNDLWISVKIRDDTGNFTYYTLLSSDCVSKTQRCHLSYFLKEL